jgi:hypothetical protein
MAEFISIEALREKLKAPDTEADRVQFLVKSAMEVVTAQQLCIRAVENLKHAVEQVTGQHWTRWKF